MKKLLLLASLLFAALLLIGTSPAAKDPQYIGANKCKMCHRKPDKGDQFSAWSKGPHAYAMESLKTDRAKEVGAQMNIHDPVSSPACISCHSTFGSIDAELAKGLRLDEGVSCESCHGPGSMYKSASVMRDREMSISMGMILPEEAVCRKCHNSKSPTFKSFNYGEALKKIAHPDPTLQ